MASTPDLIELGLLPFQLLAVALLVREKGIGRNEMVRNVPAAAGLDRV